MHYVDEGDGPPILLLHGWPLWSYCYRDIIRDLSPRYRCIAPDMIGFGGTDKPDPANFEYSQAARVKHLREFLDALGIERASFIGNSMGGCTALGLAAQSPQRVGRLVLMGSAGLVTALHADLMPVINYDFTREGMVKLIRALTNPGFQPDPELIDYRLKKSLEPQCRAAYGAAMKWIKEQGGLFYPPENVARVACPTLVVNGKDDKVVPVANAYRFLELIPDSWGYIMPHCGHWAMMERPREFSNACLAFLAEAA
jgi:2-hydroxy-6-oxo-6-(2'-aminophenyl)hexa-2,4-dienoate hydrolase